MPVRPEGSELALVHPPTAACGSQPAVRAVAAWRCAVLSLAAVAAIAVGCAAPPHDPPVSPTPASPPAATAPVAPPESARLDASNTGWQHAGVSLQTIDCGSRGELVIDKPGTVIDSKRIPCTVLVTANDVTISRSQVESTGFWGIRQVDDYAGLTVTDTEIIGTSGCAVGVGFAHVHLERLNIHGCADGAHPETGSVLTESWIHGLDTTPGQDGTPPHNDGVQTTGGSDITITNNKIENPGRQTSAIMIGGEFGAPSNITIAGNFLDGGNYTIYMDPKGTNRTVRNNTFTKNFVFGPVSMSGAVSWSDNRFVDGSAVNE